MTAKKTAGASRRSSRSTHDEARARNVRPVHPERTAQPGQRQNSPARVATPQGDRGGGQHAAQAPDHANLLELALWKACHLLRDNGSDEYADVIEAHAASLVAEPLDTVEHPRGCPRCGSARLERVYHLGEQIERCADCRL